MSGWRTMSTIETEQRPGDRTTEDLFLGGALKIRQPRNGYRAGTDAVLLAALIGSDPTGPVLDAGAGVGVVGLCVAARFPKANVVLVEREPHLAALARRNVDDNGLTARVQVIEADIMRASKRCSGTASSPRPSRRYSPIRPITTTGVVRRPKAG